ncbi:hypothetical protein RvY_06836 [Ramazzottius varieornatus]|uniref:Uncharacterized protein n=1 Tax=Ramazzottius varieornatus TaxID=947166 RepID=A0A1D1UZZ3_RAMVA|nr:hypothetical protein RvY_06836 [Ramazzottius varieornatus]
MDDRPVVLDQAERGHVLYRIDLERLLKVHTQGIRIRRRIPLYILFGVPFEQAECPPVTVGSVLRNRTYLQRFASSIGGVDYQYSLSLTNCCNQPEEGCEGDGNQED